MMSNAYVFFMGVMAGMLVVLSVANVFQTNLAAYKQGQIDAMTGNIAFELKLNNDGSTSWTKKEK